MDFLIGVFIGTIIHDMKGGGNTIDNIEENILRKKQRER